MSTSVIDRLGTATTPGATTVMLLGAGELGKEMAIACQRLGVEVIAVDRYPDAPAMQVAHRSHVIDMTDAAALRAVIEDERPQFVVPEIEAIATEVLLQVEREGIAEVIPSARAVSLTMDREGIRRLASEELGLPTSAYEFANSVEELRAAVRRLGFPSVVKPVMSSSGKGQTVLHSADDVERAWATAIDGGRVAKGRVIVERFVEFDYEITLLTVRAYDPVRGVLATHFCEPIGHYQVAGDYVESWQPQPMLPAAYDSATSIAGRITSALGDRKLLGRGIFGVELFVKDEEVYFSEVSPRPHDTGLVTLASQRLSEFELHIRAVLGLPVDTTLISPAASAVIYGRVDSDSLAFENVAAALSIAETDIRLFAKPQSSEKRRVGVVVATADTVNQARENAVRAASVVKPVDTQAATAAAADAPQPAAADPEDGSATDRIASPVLVKPQRYTHPDAPRQ